MDRPDRDQLKDSPIRNAKGTMRTFLNLIFILLIAGSVAAAQTAAAKPTLAKRPAPESTGLPTEATVDSFLRQQFGYEPDLSWKITGIQPSLIPGLAEVTVVLANQQGQQFTRFYVAPDGMHALVGEIIPFGAHPFEPDRKLLEKGITGPERGP